MPALCFSCRCLISSRILFICTNVWVIILNRLFLWVGFCVDKRPIPFLRLFFFFLDCGKGSTYLESVNFTYLEIVVIIEGTLHPLVTRLSTFSTWQQALDLENRLIRWDLPKRVSCKWEHVCIQVGMGEAGSGEEAGGRTGSPTDLVGYEIYWLGSIECSCYQEGPLKPAHVETNPKIWRYCYVISGPVFPSFLLARKRGSYIDNTVANDRSLFRPTPNHLLLSSGNLS